MSVIYSNLQEFQLKSNILKLIPSQAQKGLSTFNVNFSCLDVTDEYIAIGSSVGILYLYDRKIDKLLKLRNENYKDPITCVKLLVSLECLVSFGCQSGLVLAFKVPFDFNIEVEKFTVQDLHTSPVTVIEWAKNGLKFFTGDQQGTVVCTEIDHMEHQSRSRILMMENSEIIQLSYNRLNLLVSTLHRSLLYNLNDSKITQIGKKDRKSPGRFGAIFWSNGSNTDYLYASRQGQRLWKSNINGVIEETFILKNALIQPHPNISLLSSAISSDNLENFQFGPLRIYDNKYILMWSESTLVLIDPNHQAVVASCTSLYPIKDVATCSDEIFIVQGYRHMIRIASQPERFFEEQKEASVIDEIFVPFKELRSTLKERSESVSVHSENSSGLFNWLKRNRSSSAPNTFEVENNNVEQNDEPLPEISKLNGEEYMPVQVPSLVSILSKGVKRNEKSDFQQNDKIVYKPPKKNKKHKKVRFSSDNSKISNLKVGNISPKDNVEQIDHVYQNDDHKVIKDGNENNSIKENTDSFIPIEINVNESDNENNVPAEDDSDGNITKASPNDLGNSDKGNNFNVIDKSTIELKIEDTNFNSNSENESNQVEIYSSITDNVNEPDIEMETLTPNNDENFSDEGIDNSLVDVSSLSLVDSDDPPKYGLNWVEYNTKDNLLDLSISNKHIFWIDVNHKLYISDIPVLGLEWTELQQPAEKISVSPSETIVWILYKGTVYTTVQKSIQKFSNIEWVSIARNIVSISVDDHCGWYVSSSGTLLTQQNLDVTKPFNYPDTVHCSLSIDQVACRDNVLWILSTSGHLYYRENGNKKLTLKSTWNEIKFEEISSVINVYLSANHTAWIIDQNGFMWFLIGVTDSTPKGIGRLWQVELSTYFSPSTSYFSKTVMNVFNAEAMMNFLQRKQQVCISASDIGVWFCKTLDNNLYRNQNTIIGHAWLPVIPVGTASATKWTLICAKGVHKVNGGVWCQTSTHELICLNASLHTPISVDLPCSEQKVKCIECMSYHLWLLTVDGTIYVRRGITSQCMQGVWWQQLDLSQLHGVQLSHISCSHDIVWACDNSGNVFARIGLLNPSDTSQLSQAWITIDSRIETSLSFLAKLSSIGKKIPLPIVQPNLGEPVISKVYVGSESFMVWALDDRESVYVREGITYKLPIGEKWTLIPELCAKELCISSTAVWIVESIGKIYRRFGISESNPGGDYWKLIPGNIDHLSVTLDDDLWGLHENKLFFHTSYAFNNSVQCSRQVIKSRTISEDDWEDIMEDINI